jgi:hypothetical protein
MGYAGVWYSDNRRPQADVRPGALITTPDHLPASVAAVCRAAVSLKQSGRPPLALFWFTGHKKFRNELTESVLAAELRANPDLIDTWCTHSADRRFSPAWYFDRKADGIWVVGYFHDDSSRRTEDVYADAAIVCANFILEKWAADILQVAEQCTARAQRTCVSTSVKAGRCISHMHRRFSRSPDKPMRATRELARVMDGVRP